MAWRPSAGYDYNPLLKMVERNDPCICGSGKKWKKCCMDKIPQLVDDNTAMDIREAPTLEAAIEAHDAGIERFRKYQESKLKKAEQPAQDASDPANADVAADSDGSTP